MSGKASRPAKNIGKGIFFLVLVMLLMTACEQQQQAETIKPVVAETGKPQQTIYFGGDIITMEGDEPEYVEALVESEGKIIFLGTKQNALSEYPDTGWRDLDGKTLLPAFIDPHSHYFSSLTVANQVKLFAPPAGPGKDIPSILAELRSFRDDNKVPAGVMIQAYGYDDTVMPGGIGLTREDLDADFPDNPVLVVHVSMHGAVLNSAAMKKYNISAETETPPGGIIVRKEGSNEPAGLLMETAYLPIYASLPKPAPEQEVDWSRAGQMLYAAAGITTAHEGATHLADLELMQRVAADGANIIDIIVYPFILDAEKILEKNPPETFGKYVNGLKLGGIKITADGSPQGKTAYFSKPYLSGGPGGEENWYGEPTFPEDTLNGMVKRVYELGLPLNYHANGDAAIDMFLRAHEYAAADDLTRDRNVTVIHSQFVRPDQLSMYVEYKITPSFYTLHTFYFAEAHIKNRGQEQAAYISPMRDAIDMGIRPSNHTDFVVAPLDQMFVLWSAVNRVSRGGEVIGANQRISPFEALQTMTINVALQYDEETSKGSLAAGKLADLVILSGNPLSVDPGLIRDIKVIETIKGGKTIYLAE